MIGSQGSDLRVPATAKLIALVLGMASVTSTSKFGAPIRRFSFWQSPRPCRTPALTRSSWNWTSLSMFRREERDLLRCSLLSFHALAPYFAWNVFDVATSCRSNSTCRRVSRNFHTDSTRKLATHNLCRKFLLVLLQRHDHCHRVRERVVRLRLHRGAGERYSSILRNNHCRSQLTMVDRLQVTCCACAAPSDAVVRSCMQPLQSRDGDHRPCRCLPCALPSRSTFRRAAAHVVAR